MFHSRIHLALLALPGFAPLAAAGTLTVGPAGSGAQFTEIQAAIDAASDDDVILVKPGTYQHITVSKPLRILGEGTGIIRIEGPDFGAKILGTGAGKEVVLSGVEVRETTFSSAMVLLQDCAGTVVLSSVSVPGTDFGWTGVEIHNCARAVLLDSQISGAGSGAVSALDSEVWLANTTAQGMSNVFDGGADGIELENSTLHAWRSEITGGDAIIVSPKFGGYGGHGLYLQNSRADLFGGPEMAIRGGNGDYDINVDLNYPGGRGVLLSQSSQARIQASIPISGGLDGLGSTSSPDIDGDATSAHTFDTKVFPTLAPSAHRAPLGSAFSLTLTGNPGGYQVLFMSLHTGPTTTYRRVDGSGLLDRVTMVRVASAVLPPSGAIAFHFNVPNNAALLGSTLFFQAAEKFPNGFGFLLGKVGSGRVNAYAIGNPVLVTIPR